MTHLQGLFNNPYPVPNQPNFSYEVSSIHYKGRESVTGETYDADYNTMRRVERYL